MFETFAEFWWQFLLLALGCYLFGNINYAVVFSHLIKKSDVRNYGSGNPGTANMYRVYGLRMGALTFVCDALKGVIGCLVARLVFSQFGTDAEYTAGYIAGMFAVLGHVFPVFYKFRGGKGVATAIGLIFVMQPFLALSLVLPCLLILFITDRVSVMSVLLAIFVILWTWLTWCFHADMGLFYHTTDMFCNIMISVTYATVLFAHRHNIKRLFTGKEKPIGLRKAFSRKSDKKEK